MTGGDFTRLLRGFPHQQTSPVSNLLLKIQTVEQPSVILLIIKVRCAELKPSTGIMHDILPIAIAIESKHAGEQLTNHLIKYVSDRMPG